VKEKDEDSSSQDKDKDKDEGIDVRKQSLESLESFADENQAQNTSDIPNDNNQSEQSHHSESSF